MLTIKSKHYVPASMLESNKKTFKYGGTGWKIQ